ncbi:prolipoprotein diacylglyceryl transferase [Gordonia polyisoprenivorans]|uniref:prolipoprotein diacylglyceryl transferase n=1 Tax=Gordonia polyisoprenivorans TaxID=84595 RepID=UPI001AD62F1E|nr:prolipoprotein diacylglyceryl transferase [Gordonia polyisoprenivorans]QTI67507.1 prolipoprotein diacylglyceryl transferase [Gordonia polyisoprenivorans]
MTVIAPTTTLLAYIPSPPQGVWHLGPVPLRAYALCIIVGIIVAVWWGDRRWIARGGQPGEVLDIAIWAVPFGLIGGRIYHVLTDWSIYFGGGGKSPIDVFKIWDGGLGIWGAVILGALGAWIGARRHGIRLPAFGDAIAPAILLAQAIGRLGNYFNQELYGRPTTVPWGLEIYERTNGIQTGPNLINGTSTGQVYEIVHPTFLYELVWNVLVVIALVVLDRRFRIGHGRLFALYVAGYCVGRFVVELLRSDTAYTFIAGIRINVFTSALLFVCAAIYFVVATKGRERGLEMYYPDRAEELEALGVVGYVDDRYPDHELDAEREPDDEPDEDEPFDSDGEMTDAGDDSTATEVIDKGIAEHDEEAAVDPELDEDVVAPATAAPSPWTSPDPAADATPDSAPDTPDSAQPDADSAPDTPDSAQPDADSAPDTADSAQPDADSASETADSALTDADSAEPDADSAQPDADSAPSDADSAQPDADSAPPEAESAEPDAHSAQPDADSAPDTADSAQPDADGASPDEDSAPTAPDSAKDTPPTR